MSRVLVVFGTRPEAIKLAPVIHALKRRKELEPLVCVTGQHRQLLDEVLTSFEISADYDLDIMIERQSLTDITTRTLARMQGVLENCRPECVLVQGDTTTTLAAALAAFYGRASVGHVEAGLRTYDKYNPFPEEINRRVTSHLADYHFAPTGLARKNLLEEGVSPDRIYVTGNTVVDALQWMIVRQNGVPGVFQNLPHSGKLVLVTAHRRENWGAPLRDICRALIGMVESDLSMQIVFPVHPNPVVREAASQLLTGKPRIHLVPPLSYPDLLWLMSKASLVVTDSGGIQEEVVSLGKPVVILRQATERPEAIGCGMGILVGTEPERIVEAVNEMSNRLPVSLAKNPFGDGTAGEQIAKILAGVLLD